MAMHGFGWWVIPRRIELDGYEERAVLKAAWARWARGPALLACTVTLFVALVAAMTGVFVLVSRLFGPFAPLVDALAQLMVVIAGLVAFETVILRFGLRRCIYAELRERGHDLCVRCAYDMSALPGEAVICPECGTRNGALGPGTPS